MPYARFSGWRCKSKPSDFITPKIALNLENRHRDESPLSICRNPAWALLSGGLMRAGPRMPAPCHSNAFPKAALQAKAITRRVWLSALPETACVYRFAVHSPVEAFAFACRTSVEPVGLQRIAGLFFPSAPQAKAAGCRMPAL